MRAHFSRISVAGAVVVGLTATGCSSTGGSDAGGGDGGSTSLAGSGGSDGGTKAGSSGAGGKSTGGSSAGGSSAGGSGAGGSGGSAGSSAGGQSGGAGGSSAGGNGGTSAGGSAGTSVGGSGGGKSGSGGTGGSSSTGGGSTGGASGTGGSGGSGGTAGAAGMSVGAAGAAGASSGCVPTSPTEVKCDGLDDDCNGLIDDVDVGHDGVCDCLRIGIIGNPGANPSSNFQSWLQSLGTTVERVNTKTTDTFDAALLAKYDVAVFDRLVRPYTSTEADTLRVWVEAGGGFVTMSGYANNPDPDFYPNDLLLPFGLSYGGNLSSATADVFVPHPVTKGITSVTFLGGYVVTPTVVPGGLSTLIASNSDGHIGYVHERGKGRGMIWGDEWIEFDSEWATMPQIQSFWVNVMSWVGPQDHCQVPKP